MGSGHGITLNCHQQGQGLKKIKAGAINWQPEMPEGEDETSLLKHKEDIINELKKHHPDESVIRKKMSLTFALGRKDINGKMRIADIIRSWPALQSISAVII